MIKLNYKNMGIREEELTMIHPMVDTAYATLMERTGAGSEMLGWLFLLSMMKKNLKESKKPRKKFRSRAKSWLPSESVAATWAPAPVSSLPKDLMPISW